MTSTLKTILSQQQLDRTKHFTKEHSFQKLFRRRTESEDLGEVDEHDKVLNRILQEKHNIVESLLKTKASKTQMYLALQAELDEMKRKERESLYLWKLEVESLRREGEAVVERCKIFERDLNDKTSLEQYAKLIKESAPQKADSKYVMHLQNQISKASQKIKETRMEIVTIEESYSNEITRLKQELCQVVGEKCLNEMALGQHLRELEEKKIIMELSYTGEFNANNVVIKALEEDINQRISGNEPCVEAGVSHNRDTDQEIEDLMKELFQLAAKTGFTESKARLAIEKRKSEILNGDEDKEKNCSIELQTNKYSLFRTASFSFLKFSERRMLPTQDADVHEACAS